MSKKKEYCIQLHMVHVQFGLHTYTAQVAMVINNIVAQSYHYNYHVHNGIWHYYDDNMPNIIQVSEHRFVESCIIQMWCTDMNVAW